MLLIQGVVILGFTAFFEPIANDFNWSYTQVSLAASIVGMESGLLAPFVGLLVDRWGPRKLIICGVIITGLGFMLLSRITSLGMFYAVYALIATGISITGYAVTMPAVVNWFRKKVATAVGIMACGFPLGSLLVPVIVRLIDVYDWRNTMLILAVGMWVTGLPLSLVVRHKPEKYGYLPDGEQGEPPVPGEGLHTTRTPDADIGAKRALTSRAFWHIALAMTFQAIATNAVVVHVMPYLSSVAFTRSASSLVATVVPLVSVAGRLGSGWSGDRFSKKKVSSWCLAVGGVGLLFFDYASSERVWLLVPFAILFGIGWGGNITLRPALLSEYFGRAKFGTILGSMAGLVAIGTLVGPIFAGWVFDNRGSYHVAWLVLTFLIFAALLIMATTPKPKAGSRTI